jgi:hypothetical protein
LRVTFQYNSIGLINTISLWQYKNPRRSCHVVTCSRQSVNLPFISRGARLYFSQVRRVFTVEHCLERRSYLTCHSEFRDTFVDSPVPKERTVARLMNHFRDTLNMSKRVDACNAERGGHFLYLI